MYKRELEALKTKNEQQIEVKINEKIEEQKRSCESDEETSNSSSWATVTARKKHPISQQIVVNAAINESRAREKRKGNVVIFGINESSKAVGAERHAEDKQKN